MAFKMKFGSLGNQPFTPFPAPSLNQITPGLGAHPGTETVLLFA